MRRRVRNLEHITRKCKKTKTDLTEEILTSEKGKGIEWMMETEKKGKRQIKKDKTKKGKEEKKKKGKKEEKKKKGIEGENKERGKEGKKKKKGKEGEKKNK